MNKPCKRVHPPKDLKKENHQLKVALNQIIFLSLHRIIEYKGHAGFSIHNLHTVTNIERDTPLDFQERFFLLMDTIAPVMDYARRFIKKEHPDVLYLFNWLVKLYVDEDKQ
jgi:hypothetical protein